MRSSSAMLRTTVTTIAALAFLIAPAEGSQTAEALYNPSVTKAKSLQTWQQFNNQFQKKWKVKWNPVTGTPHRISGYHIHVPETLTKENAEPVTRRLLENYKSLLQIDPASLALSKADLDAPRRPEAGAGTWHVYYRQMYRGLPVYGGAVRLVISNQMITVLGSDYYPGIQISTDPRISQEQAVQLVISHMGEQMPLTPEDIKLIVYPKAITRMIEYHLAWQITMPVTYVSDYGKPFLPPSEGPTPEKMPAQWCYFVDANDGSIIERVNLLVFENLSGRVSGTIRPCRPTDAPRQEAISGMHVTITQGGTPLTTVTDTNGDYVFTGLAPGAADLEAHLKGPHVEVHNDATPDPDASHAATVEVPGSHDWDWSPDDPSPDDVETNVFYHVNRVRDWYLRGGPFDISPLPYPMQVYVQHACPICTASSSTRGLEFCDCNNDALCSDIIYHEYTHRIAEKIYFTDGGVPYQDFPYAGQTGAMDEGWADYFPASIINDPNHGEGCSPSMIRNIDTPDHIYPRDWCTWNMHGNGMIFSGALWDLRSALGADQVDRLALAAMKELPLNFSEYLDAMLQADDNPTYSSDPSAADSDPANGTPNIDSICSAFYDHGIYHESCAAHTETPVAIITSPHPLVTEFYSSSSAPLISIVGTAQGSSSDGLANFMLEYARQSAPSSWMTAGITLAGGGTSPVEGGVLGQWDTTGIPDGGYVIRLTATDAGGRTATAIAAIMIDRTLMSGWPQPTLAAGAPKVYFFAPPVVADLDPGYAGLEVAATGMDGRLYVWHADGTTAPDYWPQSTGNYRCAPAVGDLGADGTLKVVVGGRAGYVDVFDQRGHLRPPGWFTQCGGTIYAVTPALGDLDGDGDLEVVVGCTDNKVYAWDHDGQPVPNWPVTTSAQVDASVAIGDLDSDGLSEVVVGSRDGNVYVWQGNGSLLWQVTLPPPAAGQPPPRVSASAALGDLDGDGDMEVVVGAEDGKVYAWHHNGSPVNGWPQDADRISWPLSAVISDLDCDGDLEVIVMSTSGRIHVWEGNGDPVPGWPPAGLDYGHGGMSPVIGDVDGDGDMEVVAALLSSQLGNVYCFHHDGSLVAGWPRPLSIRNQFSSAAISDIDQDGDVEIIIGSDGVWVWDLPSAYADSAMEWPFERHDIQRTGTEKGVCLPKETLCWPRHRGVPGNDNPPVLDGKVQEDVGWRGAYRLTYGSGTEPPDVAFQGLKHASDQYLYLSFEVRNDPTFDDNDLVVINLRASVTGATATAGDDRRIFIYPLCGGEGAAGPDCTLDTTEDKVDRPPRKVTVWGNSASWTELPLGQPQNFEVKVRSYPDGSSKAWNLEVKVPTSKAVGGPEWIDLAEDFLFYFNVIRVSSVGDSDTAVQFHWPRSAPEVPGPVDSYAFSPAEWGRATKSNTATCKGVWLTPSDVGTTNPPSSEIKFTGPPNTFTNTFFANVHNDAEVGGVGCPAEDVRVRFRLANWGIPGPGDWADIPAANPACPSPSLENNPTCPSDVPAATSGGPGTQTFNLRWMVPDDRIPEYQAHPHQCILAELDSLSNTNIVTKSVYRNIDFVTASKFTRPALVSAKGYGPPPKGTPQHQFDLYVTTRKGEYGEMTPNVSPATEPAIAVPVDEDEQVSWLNWAAHGYRHTGRFVVIQGKRYAIVDPVGSFGYVVKHVGQPVKEWRHELTGAKKVAANLYSLQIPPEGVAQLSTQIEPQEVHEVCLGCLWSLLRSLWPW